MSEPWSPVHYLLPVPRIGQRYLMMLQASSIWWAHSVSSLYKLLKITVKIPCIMFSMTCLWRSAKHKCYIWINFKIIAQEQLTSLTIWHCYIPCIEAVSRCPIVGPCSKNPSGMKERMNSMYISEWIQYCISAFLLYVGLCCCTFEFWTDMNFCNRSK